MTKNDLRIRLIEARLRKAGVPFRRLEDVPPKAIRAVYRFGLPDLRMIELPAKTIRAAIQNRCSATCWSRGSAITPVVPAVISPARKEVWTIS